MSETIQLRITNHDETDTMADLEEPDNDVYGKLSRSVSDELGEYIEVEISEDASVMASTTGDTKNYGKFETAAGAVVGLGVRKTVLEGITGEETPDAIGLTFRTSTEEDYDEADAVPEEEVSGLIDSSDDSDDSDEEEVEISDEELELTE